MSLLDDEDVLVNDHSVMIKNEWEKIVAKSLLTKNAVKCIIAEDEVNILVKKIAEIYNLNINYTTTFADLLQSLINKASNPDLKEHSNRKIFSLDCRGLRKGDAYGWLQKLQLQTEVSRQNGPIVIINNVTQIPDGDRNFYDDPVYVTNLLLRSWKNEDIYAGDIHIDRRNMTIILTASSQGKDILLKECGWNSYYWIGDFNKWEKETYKLAEKIVNDKIQ